MNWQIAEALVMKGWLETRWRLIPLIVWPAIVIALNYQVRYNPPAARNVVLWMGIVLSCLTVMLAGSGVKSQAPTHISFPEGLAGSTQFTISLPVSRAWLIVLRAGIGLFELYAATLISAFTVWQAKSELPVEFDGTDHVIDGQCHRTDMLDHSRLFSFLFMP